VTGMPFKGNMTLRKQYWIILVVVGLLAISAVACGGKSKKKEKPTLPETALPGAPQWGFGSNAISLRLQADDTLNQYENKPHTLSICVYQLQDPNTFKDMSQTEDGLIKLLSCQNFGKGVAGVNRIIIQPGEIREMKLDRAEGAKFVGLVAGYFDLKADRAVLLLDIPILTYKKGLIFKSNYQVPGNWTFA
jgi:type VI secretion system VasD/TssJ family lipoprotein